MANTDEKLIALKNRTYPCQELVGKLDVWIRKVQRYLADPDLTLTPDQRLTLIAAYDSIVTELNASVSNLPLDLTTFDPDPSEYE